MNRRQALAAAASALAAAAAGCDAAPTPRAASTPKASPSPVKPSPSAAPTLPTSLPPEIGTGPLDRPLVALTFHGQGDANLVGQLLSELNAGGAHVTVLAVGTWLSAQPAMAKRILDGGHELGNHTQRHLDVNAMSEADATAEIAGCAQRLRRLTGSVGAWFRPSRAARASPLVTALARRAGYPHVLSYDVDSLDFTSPGASAVARNVLDGIRNGSVVSLHFGYADTVAALPALLDELDRRGLRAVTATELIG